MASSFADASEHSGRSNTALFAFVKICLGAAITTQANPSGRGTIELQLLHAFPRNQREVVICVERKSYEMDRRF